MHSRRAARSGAMALVARQRRHPADRGRRQRIIALGYPRDGLLLQQCGTTDRHGFFCRASRNRKPARARPYVTRAMRRSPGRPASIASVAKPGAGTNAGDWPRHRAIRIARAKIPRICPAEGRA